MSDRRDAATGNPIVEPVASRIDGDVRTTSVRGELPAKPIAPASLIDPISLVADTSWVWVHAPYPGDSAGPLPDHGPDFCLLTYESLEPGEVAYTDGRGSWVSPAGYKKFIESDLLRLRGRQGPSDNELA